MKLFTISKSSSDTSLLKSNFIQLIASKNKKYTNYDNQYLDMGNGGSHLK